MTKYLCAIVLGLFLALFLILQVGAGEKVRLVHDDPFPPFAVYKDGRSEGIIIDILQEALKRVNIEPAFIPAHMDKTQDLVKAGDADGLALLTRDEISADAPESPPGSGSRQGGRRAQWPSQSPRTSRRARTPPYRRPRN